MLCKRVIPCLDVADGRVKKGVRFKELRDAGDPVAVAAAYDAQGADEICYLDISASAEGRATTLDVVRATAERVFLPLTVGGGVRSVDDVRQLLLAGADKAGINTAAVADPALVRRAADAFGNQAIVVAVDAREGKVSVEGWTEDTSADAVEVGLAVARAGAGAVLYTDIGRDGMRTGPNLDATARLVRRLDPCPVIASGGVARIDDLDALLDTGAFAVVVGKALYEGVFTVEDALKRVGGREHDRAT